MVTKAGSDRQLFFLQALEQSIAAIVLVNERNEIEFFNAAAASLWGYERHEILGRTAEFLLPQAVRAHMQKSREGGQPQVNGMSRNLLLERKDGGRIWATFSLSKVEVEGRACFVALARDISHEVASREENRLLLLAINNTDRAVFVLDHERRIVQTNRAFTDLFGYEAAEAIGRVPTTFLASPKTDREALASLQRESWAAARFQKEILARCKDGRDIWVRASISPVQDDAMDGSVRNLVVALADVTEERQIRDLERDVLSALTSSLSFAEVGDFICRRIQAITPGVIASVTRVADGRIWHWAAPHLPPEYPAGWNGVEIGEGMGSCGTCAHRGEPVMVEHIETDPLWATFKHLVLPLGLRACWSSPVKRRDGSVAGTFAFYFRERATPDAFLERVAAASVHLCALAIEREESEQQIAQLSHFDRLTGLPNRAHLHTWVDELLGCAGDDDIAFLVVDLDHFKDINETLGHQGGDRILVKVADRLEKLVPANGLVSRSGEDAFAIVVPGCNVQAASALAEKILKTLKKPFRISGISLNLSASIGISLYQENGRDRETVIKHADTAMYRVKAAGRGSYLFFSPEMNRVAQDRVVLGAALRNAIATDRLRLFYQPQVRPQDGALYGVEALARWSDPALGEVSPMKFIALAEEIGEIEAIGRWSLREACRQMSTWRKQGVGIPAVSVNLSSLHFRNRELPDFIGTLLKEHGFPAHCLTVEITESVMIDQTAESLDIVQALRKLGVGLSMDDFGTGFSSLSKLADLPFTELKIDRSFMRNFRQGSHAKALATAVLRIGQSLGLTVVAEGVETEAQRKLLVAEGCDVAQGYLFSRPLPPCQLVEWVGSNGRALNPAA